MALAETFVSLDEDQSRVRHANAALVLGLFRRGVVSDALTWLEVVQTTQARSRVGIPKAVCPARLWALIFAATPTAWRQAT